MSDLSTLDALRKRIAALEDSLDRQARIQEALHGSRFSAGVSFFDQLCRELAQVTGAQIAFVGTLLPGGRHVRTVGLSVDGAPQPGFEYSLDGTPCDEVVGKEGFTLARGIRARYPQDARLQELAVEGYCGIPLADTHRRPIGHIVLLTRQPILDTAGTEALLRVAAARASAELERKRAEDRLWSVFDSNVVGIVFWNSAGDITDANDTFLQMVRHSREDLDSGRVRWKDITPPQYEWRDATALSEIAETGVCTPYEKEFLRKDGSRISVLVGGSRVTRTPLAGVAFVLDLSLRKTAEKSARESDELNRQVLANMREGICVHDCNLRYLHFNPVMERITGLQAQDVLGKHPLELFPILKEMGIYTDLERALLGELRTSPDLPYHSKGAGETRWTRTESLPLRDSAGAIVGVIAVVHDITELKGTEEALRGSERRLSEALLLTQERVVQLEEQVQKRVLFAGLVGKSVIMQDVYRRLRLAAESDVTVLLTGESGTGKELAAAAVHSQSQRRAGPFIAVNCSAIPEGILESELFGHVKGAFTGAIRDKVGLFQAAEGGTLFLDEVGDMSPILQVKVLRVLQEREIRRVGDDQAAKVNVRLVTATNRDLSRMIEEGLLREDFFYRIRVFEIQLPALRERKEDVPLLVDHLIEELSGSTGRRVRGIEPDALKALLDHPWPGNVRELRNAIEHAFVTFKGDRLRLEDLPFEIRARVSAPSAPAPRIEDSEERARILEALQRSSGKRAEAARRLGISRVTLWHRMRTLGIQPAKTPGPLGGGGARRT